MFTRALKRFSTLVLGEHNGKTISPNTLKILNAAKDLSQPVHILLCGQNLSPVLQSAKLPSSACEKIYFIDHEDFKYNPADAVTNVTLLLQEKNSYQNIITSSSTFGKDTIPRIAAKLDIQALSSVTNVKKLTRPIYADNALCLIQNHQNVLCMTLRETNFEAMELAGDSIAQEEITGNFKGKTRVVREEKSAGDKVSLGDAKIVVSGGRALKSKENFDILDKLAAALGKSAAVGASRAAVDAGYVPNDYQIGQTGKVVAPDLYFAIGISGAIQHVAGMKDSKVIVAINKDPDCPMFQIANYSLEGDLFSIVPELTEKLQK